MLTSAAGPLGNDLSASNRVRTGEEFGVRTDRRQRCPQFVTCVRDELTQPAFGVVTRYECPVDMIKHVGERRVHVLDFRDRIQRGSRPGNVGVGGGERQLRDGSSSRRDARKRLERTAYQQGPRQAADGQYPRSERPP